MEKKVLLVGNSNNKEDLKILLEAFNYSFEYISFEKIEQQTLDIFNLIIVNENELDLNHYSIIQSIKDTSQTKVIIISQMIESQLKEQFFNLGILDCIITEENDPKYTIKEIRKLLKHLEILEFGEILIIDSSAFVKNQIKTILSPRNYKIDLASNSGESLKLIEKNYYDLIILDYEVAYGDKFIKYLKANEKYEEIPIVVISSRSSTEITRTVLKSGAIDFIKKPFFVEEFILKIDYFVENSKKDEKIKQQQIKLNEFVDTLKLKVEDEVRKNEEQQLVLFAQSRHAQMGEMMSMIAHQWRQPLNSLSLAVQLLYDQHKKSKLNDEKIEQFKKRTSKQITYMSDTINTFRDFFIPQTSLEKFNVLKSIKEAIFIIEPTIIQHNIKLNINSGKDKVLINGFHKELNQAILNIINNAKDALISNNDYKNREINIILEKNHTETSITIQDNAGGIKDDIIDKIFDPYFSTKIQKNGTGLGLYMTKTIIEDKFKGEIKVSNNNQGAVFKIIIPN